jgi:UDP-N-acetylglucosamine 2-epimerase
MKITTIVGARPQFIKAAAVSRSIIKHNTHNPSRSMDEILVHTGQHYDHCMSQVFFEELEMGRPDYNLGIGSGSHARMTGAMMIRIEEVLVEEDPEWVLVYGDTNTTLAAAITAVKLNIPVAHVESGLRSFNRSMPEELNRTVTDRVSRLLFCPTNSAVENLEREGITEGVFYVGDVMYDSFRYSAALAAKKSKLLTRLKLRKRGYCLATVHREENTSHMDRLEGLFSAFDRLAHADCPFIVPLHPRTEKALAHLRRKRKENPFVKLIEPVSYLDMVALEGNARAIFTDSGGVQKEAYFAGVPCVTLRDETEWTETLAGGWNRLAGVNEQAILNAYEAMEGFQRVSSRNYFGDGAAADKIVDVLQDVPF